MLKRELISNDYASMSVAIANTLWGITELKWWYAAKIINVVQFTVKDVS